MAKRQSKKTGYFDYGTVFVVILLLAFGLVMLYSTSSYTASLRWNDAAYFVKRQAVFATAGFVLMWFVSKWDYHVWQKFALPLFFGSIILVAYALVAGTSLNNSSRWIYIGPISVQPSEICKVAVIVFFSTMFAKLGPKVSEMKTMVKLVGFALLITAIVAVSNLSTAVIIFGIFYIMLFIVSTRTVLMMGIAAAAMGGLGLFIAFAGYRADRIKIWQHPEDYEKGYQTLQGLYAIGSGGFFGKGLGESMQKQFVPESMNDMIFSIICEELGLFGAMIIFILFLLLLWRLFFISTHAKDQFGSFLAMGILIHIAIQVILNVAVVTNTIPNTGVTLPFISYGGSALMMLMAELGIALSVSRQIEFTA